MITFDVEKQLVGNVKIIDFGTSVHFDNVNEALSVTTPEYMPPEVLSFTEAKSKAEIRHGLQPWSIDVWSLGIILLEFTLGIPMYMAYKCRLTRTVNERTINSQLQKGLLACTTRESQKILKLINQNFVGPKYLEKIFSRHKNDLIIG